MAVQGPFRMGFGELFPVGCGVVSAVTPLNDFETSTKEHPVQARDKDTGRLMWSVDVMDFDPDARERTFKVKVIADHQPVPPDAIPGTPVRPVMLEGLQLTPYIKEGMRPKIAYSLRCTGLAEPKRNSGAAQASTAASASRAA